MLGNVAGPAYNDGLAQYGRHSRNFVVYSPGNEVLWRFQGSVSTAGNAFNVVDTSAPGLCRIATPDLKSYLMSTVKTEKPKLEKSVVLVGLMGAGKSCIGKRLAGKLGVEFVDADVEIESAADCTIDEIFARFGEQAFRDGERRVIQRLLEDGPRVIATGGGAFMNAETRENVRQSAISIWLKADLDVLLERVSRRNNRPLLKKGDKRETLERLMAERYPFYAEADIEVGTGNESPDVTIRKVIAALDQFRKDRGTHAGGSGRKRGGAATPEADAPNAAAE